MSDMGVHKCDECNERFLTQEALAGHTKRHTMGENLYHCEDCNNTYLTKTAYKIHDCTTGSTNHRKVYCTNCGAMKRARGSASRQKAQCYECGEYTTFEANE